MPFTKVEVELIKNHLRDLVDDFVIKVHPIFVFKNWIYSFSGLPTEDKLKEVCHHLIDDLKATSYDDFDAETGRIRVWYKKIDEEISYGIELVCKSERVIGLD